MARSPGEKEIAKLDQLIFQLGDEDFSRREQATKDLTAYGNRALASLRLALKSKDPEVKSRAQEALDQIEIGTSSLVQAAALRHFARQSLDLPLNQQRPGRNPLGVFPSRGKCHPYRGRP